MAPLLSKSVHIITELIDYYYAPLYFPFLSRTSNVCSFLFWKFRFSCFDLRTAATCGFFRVGTAILAAFMTPPWGVTFTFLLKELLCSRSAEISLWKTMHLQFSMRLWGRRQERLPLKMGLCSIHVRLVFPLGGKIVHSHQGLFFQRSQMLSFTVI